MRTLSTPIRLSHALRASQFGAPLLALLALTAVIRLPGVARPLLGDFATKNVVNAMMARNWVRGTASFWLPAVDCLQDGKRGLHLLEVPLSAYGSGLLWHTLGGSLDVWGRLTSIAFTLASVGLLYWLVHRWHGRLPAVVAAAMLAGAPISITYGQSFLLEPSVLFFSLATLACVERWRDRAETRWMMLAAGCFSWLLLTKIYMLVLLLPIMSLMFEPRSASPPHAAPRRLAVPLVLLALATIPALAWCAFVWHRADDPALQSHVFYSLRDSSRVHSWPHPLLSDPMFYRHLLTDLATVVLTPVGLVLAVLGCVHPSARRHIAWFIGSLSLVVLLPLKFYELNYYYLPLLPPLAVLVGLGAEWLAQRIRPRPAWIALGVLLFAGSAVRYSVRPAFVTFREDENVVAAAEALRRMTTAEEPIVALHGSSPDLLYYCDRPGWACPVDHPALDTRLAAYHRAGARYVVVAQPTRLTSSPASRAVLNHCATVVRGEHYAIYELSGGNVALRTAQAARSSLDAATRH